MFVLAGVAVALLAAGDGKPPVSTFTDKRDGKVYKIVKIGRQVWLAENLNYAAKGGKCYGEDNEVEDGEEYRYTLSNAEVQANCAKYGRLYDWETAVKACPAGYHLPFDDEWTTLVDYVGGKEKAGTKLKSSAGWDRGYIVKHTGTDDYGFSALPGGYGSKSNGRFHIAGYYGYWWSATVDSAGRAWLLYMNTYDGNVNWFNDSKSGLQSVRCIQDKEAQK
jgi:uncharacterized protein (TIGR02145 family)